MTAVITGPLRSPAVSAGKLRRYAEVDAIQAARQSHRKGVEGSSSEYALGSPDQVVTIDRLLSDPKVSLNSTPILLYALSHDPRPIETLRRAAAILIGEVTRELLGASLPDTAQTWSAYQREAGALAPRAAGRLLRRARASRPLKAVQANLLPRTYGEDPLREIVITGLSLFLGATVTEAEMHNLLDASGLTRPFPLISVAVLERVRWCWTTSSLTEIVVDLEMSHLAQGRQTMNVALRQLEHHPAFSELADLIWNPRFRAIVLIAFAVAEALSPGTATISA